MPHIKHTNEIDTHPSWVSDPGAEHGNHVKNDDGTEALQVHPSASHEQIVFILSTNQRSYSRGVMLQSIGFSYHFLFAKSATGEVLSRRVSRLRKRRLNLLDVALEALPSRYNMLGIRNVFPGSLMPFPQH